MKTASAILTFLGFAYGLAWLASLPLWLGDGLQSPLFLPLSLVMMFTPALAAAIASKFHDPQGHFLRTAGVSVPKGSLGRVALYSLAGIGFAFAVSVAAMFAADALGLFRLDLKDFSAFRALIDAQLNGQPLPAQMPPLWVLAVLQMVAVLLFSPVNALAAIGEEIGWRGWLLPRLMPLGLVPAVVISGIVWGLWHAPLLLLGYNYAGAPGWLALTCMSAMCIALGVLLTWLRLRSQSVWPCAMAHGAVNAAAGLYMVLGMAGQKADMTQITLLGWSGWIVALLTGILLFVLFPIRKSVA